MIERRGGSRFAHEAAAAVRVARGVRDDQLESDRSAEPRVDGLVDDLHSAGGEVAHDPVVRERLADERAMRLTPSGGQSLRLHLERGCRKKAISRFAVRQERFDVVEQRFVAAAGLADVSEAVGRGTVEGLLPDARDLCVAIHCRGDDAGCADSNASSPVAAYRPNSPRVLPFADRMGTECRVADHVALTGQNGGSLKRRKTSVEKGTCESANLRPANWPVHQTAAGLRLGNQRASMANSLGTWLLAIVMGTAFVDPRPTGFHLLLPGRTKLFAKEVVERALRRLELPSCQRVLTDFVDSSNRTLGENLDATGLTFDGYVTRLHFIDGDGEPQCANDRVIAFTAPGNRIIYLCSARFTAMFTERREAEAILIHEILHTLGLGENPPSSAEITRQVWRRCVLQSPSGDRNGRISSR